jgi:hypothetical protein
VGRIPVDQKTGEGIRRYEKAEEGKRREKSCKKPFPPSHPTEALFIPIQKRTGDGAADTS